MTLNLTPFVRLWDYHETIYVATWNATGIPVSAIWFFKIFSVELLLCPEFYRECQTKLINKKKINIKICFTLSFIVFYRLFLLETGVRSSWPFKKGKAGGLDCNFAASFILLSAAFLVTLDSICIHVSTLGTACLMELCKFDFF